MSTSRNSSKDAISKLKSLRLRRNLKTGLVVLAGVSATIIGIVDPTNKIRGVIDALVTFLVGM